MRHHVLLAVNGVPLRVEGADVFRPLADYLRSVRRLTGTKVVCAEGDCGACTVLLGWPHDGAVEYRPVNSCILFVHQADGAHVITVEGLGGELTRVQQSMVENHGAQCGYCTPGFVMALTAFAEGGTAASGAPRGEESRSSEIFRARDALKGNLCRCTGYEPILHAAGRIDGRTGRTLDELYPPRTIGSMLEAAGDDVLVEAAGLLLYAPTTLDAAVRFKAEHPEAVLIQGATDLGVAWNKRGLRPSALLSIRRVMELNALAIEDGSLAVGAGVTLSELHGRVPELVPELHTLLGVFGSPQIRNAGTVAGNIANASPVADLLPFLFVMEAEIELASVRGQRRVPIGQLYLGYKKLAVERDEIITRLVVPIPPPEENLRLYKISKRRDLDIASFTAAIRMRIVDGRMRAVKIAYGGVAPVVLRLPRTEALLEGAEPSRGIFLAAGRTAQSEIAPISDVRGTAEYRSLLGERILMKYFVEELAGQAGEVRVSA